MTRNGVEPKELCLSIGDVHADQGFSRKVTSFTIPLRRKGIDIHMGLAEDGGDKPKPASAHSDTDRSPRISAGLWHRSCCVA